MEVMEERESLVREGRESEGDEAVLKGRKGRQ